MGKKGRPSECVLLTCTQLCQVPRGMARPSAYGSGSEGWQSLPLVLVKMLRVGAKSSTSNLLYPSFYSLKLSAEASYSPPHPYPHPVHNRRVLWWSYTCSCSIRVHTYRAAQPCCATVYVSTLSLFLYGLPQSDFQAQAVLDQHLSTEMLTLPASTGNLSANI